MQLGTIDWIIILGFFALALIIGAVVSKRAGRSSSDFFVSGRNMPWWLLGFSMVATTFSTDTPNLVTDIVRKTGVAGNWVWWAFLLTGMLTVFVYARLWRRSKVMTDIEFYELRYSGRLAAFLRGFRALYLGVFFNIMIMATVSLAAIKLGGIMLGLQPWESILYASIVTVLFSSMGGLTGVLLTDFVLFIIAMTGAVAAAGVAVQHADVQGLQGLFSHPAVAGKLNLVPHLERAADGGFSPESVNLLVSVMIIPLAVQWWSVWYPGAEPGGGGYLAQRMLAAKDERHATGAVFFFNIAHYALRPWPWIIVGLASLVVFPDLASIREAFPQVDPSVVEDDLAYPAMLTFLPRGLLGLVLASLVAAYMSTISTHLNWGSSYVVNDFYRRFLRPQASERELVRVGRLSTVLMMLAAGLIALELRNALQAFHILLQIGAGTGLIFILRWFWWRVNALSEMVAMAVSFLIACYFQFVHAHLFPAVPLEDWQRLLIGVTVTTACWLTAAWLGRPADRATLRRFCARVNAGGPGWKTIYAEAEREGDPIRAQHAAVHLPSSILCMLFGTFAVYAALFAAGLWMYGEAVSAFLMTVLFLGSAAGLGTAWKRKSTAEQGASS
ncbi:sodium:solute symporter family protein [Kiritimatiella glycovorans]|uniref:Na(+)/glucose symporter n=1 Tax=Kiritimatiella glycovorans TaxID=1307763 RepID=A0A0G3EIM5_9BACT|nr:sodium:solute symporter family protein [Kiritimatiella glycovorans]AKJ64665.1 Na(+)/glucose symporter [Kiritimatiella glycovorans]